MIWKHITWLNIKRGSFFLNPAYDSDPSRYAIPRAVKAANCLLLLEPCEVLVLFLHFSRVKTNGAQNKGFLQIPRHVRYYSIYRINLSMEPMFTVNQLGLIQTAPTRPDHNVIDDLILSWVRVWFFYTKRTCYLDFPFWFLSWTFLTQSVFLLL